MTQRRVPINRSLAVLAEDLISCQTLGSNEQGSSRAEPSHLTNGSSFFSGLARWGLGSARPSLARLAYIYISLTLTIWPQILVGGRVLDKCT